MGHLNVRLKIDNRDVVMIISFKKDRVVFENSKVIDAEVHIALLKVKVTEREKIHSDFRDKEDIMEDDKFVFESKANSTLAFNLESVFTAASID